MNHLKMWDDKGRMTAHATPAKFLESSWDRATYVTHVTVDQKVRNRRDVWDAVHAFFDDPGCNCVHDCCGHCCGRWHGSAFRIKRVSRRRFTVWVVRIKNV